MYINLDWLCKFREAIKVRKLILHFTIDPERYKHLWLVVLQLVALLTFQTSPHFIPLFGNNHWLSLSLNGSCGWWWWWFSITQSLIVKIFLMPFFEWYFWSYLVHSNWYNFIEKLSLNILHIYLCITYQLIVELFHNNLGIYVM